MRTAVGAVHMTPGTDGRSEARVPGAERYVNPAGMELQQAASPLRLVLADSTAATLATCACVSRDLWQTAKSVAIARLTILLADVDMGGLPNDDLLGANILFLLATVENDSARLWENCDKSKRDIAPKLSGGIQEPLDQRLETKSVM